MTPTVFTDSRLPGLEIRWWQGEREMQYWLKVGQRWQFRESYVTEPGIGVLEANKVAKELFSAVLDRVCNGVGNDLGVYISERV